MANPQVVDLPKDIWVLVAENITDIFILITKYHFSNYLRTYRDTGDPAPTNDDDAYQCTRSILHPSTKLNFPIDVYMKFTLTDKQDGCVVVGPEQSTMPASIDGNALVTEAQKEEFVKRGFLYSIKKVYTIPDATTYDIVFDPTAVVPSGDFLGNMVIYPPKFKTSRDSIIVTQYGGVDADDDGTIIPGINRNERSTNTALTVLRLNPTINDPGVGAFEYLVGLEETNQTSGGGSGGDETPYVPDTTVKKMVRIPNNTGDTVYFEVQFEYVEF